MIGKTFNLYLVKGLVFHSLISMLILSSVFFIFKTFDIFSDPQFSNASSLELFHMSILNLPTIFYQLTASSVLIGTIFFISRNHEENEFIVFFSAGIAKEIIVKKIFFIALFFSSILALLGELSMPNAEKEIIEFKSYLTGNTLNNTNNGNYWAKDKNIVFKIYFDDQNPNSRNVKFFTFDDKGNLKELITATLKEENNIKQIINYLRLEHNNNQIKFTIPNFREFDYQIDIDSNKQETINKYPKTMSFIELIRQSRGLKGYFYNKKNYEIEILSRLIKPLTISTLLLLIVPNLLNFSRMTSVSSNLFKAIFLALLVNFLINLSEATALRFELNHFILIVLPSILLLSFGLMKVNRRSNTSWQV